MTDPTQHVLELCRVASPNNLRNSYLSPGELSRYALHRMADEVAAKLDTYPLDGPDLVEYRIQVSRRPRTEE